MVEKRQEKILNRLSTNVVNNSSRSISEDNVKGLLKFGELNDLQYLILYI